MDTPEGTRIPPDVEGMGSVETWQVWASSPKGKQGIVEVTAPRDVLPYAVVREAFRCRLQMIVGFSVIKGGVRFTAAPIPPPDNRAASEATQDPIAEAPPAEPIKYLPGLSAEERAKIRKSAAKQGTAVVFEDAEPKP